MYYLGQNVPLTAKSLSIIFHKIKDYDGSRYLTSIPFNEKDITKFYGAKSRIGNSY